MYPKRGVNSFIILMCYVITFDGFLCMFMLLMLSKKVINFMCLKLDPIS
jgi:hypothetical protein